MSIINVGDSVNHKYVGLGDMFDLFKPKNSEMIRCNGVWIVKKKDVAFLMSSDVADYQVPNGEYFTDGKSLIYTSDKAYPNYPIDMREIEATIANITPEVVVSTKHVDNSLLLARKIVTAMKGHLPRRYVRLKALDINIRGEYNIYYLPEQRIIVLKPNYSGYSTNLMIVIETTS
jgi:hypothetical protein